MNHPGQKNWIISSIRMWFSLLLIASLLASINARPSVVGEDSRVERSVDEQSSQQVQPIIMADPTELGRTDTSASYGLESTAPNQLIRKRAGNLCLPGTDCDSINWGDEADAKDLLAPGAETNPGRRRRSVSDPDLKVSRTKQENDPKVDRKIDSKSEESEVVEYIPTRMKRGISDIIHELMGHFLSHLDDEITAKNLLQVSSNSNPGRRKRSLSDENDQKVSSKQMKGSVQEEEAFGLQELSDLTEGVKPQSLFKSISPEMVDTFLTKCLDDTTCRDELLTSRLESIKSSSENKFFKRIE